MGGHSSIFELARQLCLVAGEATLATPLEALAMQLPDGFMREAVMDLVAAGMADTLADALQDDRLDRFVAETCTAREEEALRHALEYLLGAAASAVGGDDPARLADIPAPPRDSTDLRAWAVRHGVEGWLADLDGPHDGRGDGRHDAALSRAPLAGHDTRARAHGELWMRARRGAAAELRTARWETATPPTSLTSLHGRLRTLALDPVREADEDGDEAATFVPARPVTVDRRTAVAEACLRLSEDTVTTVRLFLSGHEQRGLTAECDRCGAVRCRHAGQLAGRLLDATLDAGDRLHGDLLEVAGTPSWRRFVQALRADQGGPGGDAGESSGDADAPARGQLTFRLTRRGAGLDVSTLLRSPRRGGGLSSGRVLTLAQASRSRAVSDEDRVVLDALRLGSRPLSTNSIPADTVTLRALSQHPRVRFETRVAPFRVLETGVLVRFVEHADGLLPEVRLADVPGPVSLPPDGVGYLCRLDESADALFFAPLSAPVRRLLRGLVSFRGVLPPESFDSLGPWVAQLRQVAKVEAPEALSGAAYPVSRRLLLRLSQGPGEGLHATLSARPLPLGALWPPGHGPELVHGLVGEQSVYTRRDLAWEGEHAARMQQQLALDQHLRIEPFRFRIEGTEGALDLLGRAARLADDLDIEWSEKVRRLSLASPLSASDLSVRLFKRGHWLQLEGGVVHGETRVAVGRLLEAARRGERFVAVEGDTYAELEDALRDKLLAAEAFGIDSKEAVRLAAIAGPGLVSVLGRDVSAGDTATGQFLAQAQGHAVAPAPDDVTAHLRNYQKEGLAWLLQLASWAPGACLADEMGLGKTIQAIAFLRVRAALGPAIVIAPTSVASNWLVELARFAPDLHVHEYRGPRRREALAKLAAGQVVVTSYELLHRDTEALHGIGFATQIIDEAQWIKNARTGRARAVRRVDAEFRLALTGTPLENRLGDLFSLFAVVAPQLFGSWARFRARFAVPIERYNRRELSAHLHALVSPFILRREKAQVASELPSRTEVVHRVELSRAERELYQAATAEARENLQRRRPEDEARTAHVLADLTRLRQLACHPRLVTQRTEASSSKLAALLRMLDDLLPRGHRALIFSQFVQHLNLVREALDARGVRYQYLDGSTPAGERGERVAAFQEGDDPLFLISLKAGGTGLNLTAADYVIHLDPWWNPAAEDQASDRAHRIGQQRPVTVIKLVATDTIEERVLELHGHKRALAREVLVGNPTGAGIDLQQLEALLA